jgi:D-alanyl-lipoteichoic acid acyltransferase DltB (MBOAT superfamily)
MSFASVTFLIFLPIVFLVYWSLHRHHQWQNFFLLLSSYTFYGWWDWRFLILIVITSASSYASGLLMEHIEHKRRVVAANICLNIGILAVFKYYNFFVENLCLLLKPAGVTLDAPTLNFILPVGISFYTFQSLSYTIDVYREKLKPTRDILAFFTYIAFFPQLVAGPIERATNLLPQISRYRTFRYDEASDGLRRILWGFFKKMVVADNCAVAVNTIWANHSDSGALTLITGAVLFSFQIYCDFSGYSDIAIGTARLFGIRIMENFNLPYLSRSIGEFWRRWHISLMTWFRDYLYIPLGGSRNGQLNTVRNTLIVFFLSGLWHGANWTFIVWGLYNALLLLVERFVVHRENHFKKNQPVRWRDLPSILFTFCLAVLGWCIFRSSSMGEAFSYLSHLTQSVLTANFGSITHGKSALLWCLLLVVVEWVQRYRKHPLQIDHLTTTMRWAIYYLLMLVVFFGRGEEQTFIYFQF